MALTVEQKELLKKSIFYAQQDPKALADLLETLFLGGSSTPGPAGKAATISVGSVTASDPGSNPQITNSGNENAAVFDFVLPRGEAGPAGKNGTNGADGARGPAGQNGADGKYVTKIQLTVADGAVTGGTATFNDESTVPIEVTSAPAG